MNHSIGISESGVGVLKIFGDCDSDSCLNCTLQPSLTSQTFSERYPHFFPTRKSHRICIDLRGCPVRGWGGKLPRLPPPVAMLMTCIIGH